MNRSRSLIAVAALVAAVLPAVPASAASAAGYPKIRHLHGLNLWTPRKLTGMRPVRGYVLPKDAGRLARARIKPSQEPDSVRQVRNRPSQPWWPSGSGTAVPGRMAPVHDGRATRWESAPARAGQLPVTVRSFADGTSHGDASHGDASGRAGTPAGTGAVQVAFAPRRVARTDGLSPLMFTVSGRAGNLLVRLNYSKFAANYGGSWASRLRLVELPSCAWTTPGAPGCRTEFRLPGANDGKRSVWASVGLGSPSPGPSPLRPGRSPATFSPQVGQTAGGTVVIAAVSGPGGPQGAYTATSLSPVGSWAVQQGNFSYDYPIVVPPSLGGSPPAVALSYSSQTVNGESSAQNPQDSQIGDGWNYTPGFIEQTYEPCFQDSAATNAEQGDLCWGGYNASLTLGNHSGELIGSGPGAWHLQTDDGTKIQLKTGGPNGLWNGEYWVVTTTDGTKYYFGSDNVPGSPNSTLTTDSAWDAPVYCPATTDTCNNSSDGASSVVTNMPYRWNLDYVVDPNNNLTVYQYASETNYYQRGGSTGSGTLTSYVRGGYLKKISYGWQLADATASPAVLPADKIVFTPTPRCPTSNCATVNGTNFPDTPTDQICASGDNSCINVSPTFFSEKMLSSIDTYVLASQSSGAYNQVDDYALAQEFDHGTGQTNDVMELDSITRIGEDGSTPPLPPTTFNMTMMDNRVAGSTQSALYRPRISEIDTETGGVITVNYNPAQCRQGAGGNITNADAPTNTMTCYPAFWAPANQGDSMDWFNYYTVSSVKQKDATGVASPAQVTNYTYDSRGVAWHKNENPAEASKYRTWDEYRGYLKVETTTGVAPDPITESMTWYMRGMDGDPDGSGGTKSVSVTNSQGDSYTDSDVLSGQQLEVQIFTAKGGTIDKAQLSGPWSFNQTASMPPPPGSGLGTLTAQMLTQVGSRARRLLANGNWQVNSATTYYNGTGQVVALDDAPAGLPELCTSTSYATPPSGNAMMLNYQDRVTTVTGAYASGSCPSPTSSNIVSDTKSYYDDESATNGSLGPFGSLTSPGGLPTGLQHVATWPSGGNETWHTESATQHDGDGRITSQSNADNEITTTTYKPATGALPTSVTTTNALGWPTVKVMDQARQLPVKITDQNGEVTNETYDALGRLTSVTLPINQISGADSTAEDSYKFGYFVTGTGISAIKTETLLNDGTYAADVKFYDGMLQEVEDQSSTANGAAGGLVSDTSYDSHGWVASVTTSPFYETTTDPENAATPAYFGAANDQIPGQTVDSYDGQGRVTTAAFYANGKPQWQTTDAYPGMDETDITPPAGGTATVVITNSIGQKSQTEALTDSAGDADITGYGYTPTGQLANVTDDNGNTWTYNYNLLGQKTSVTDPATAGSAGPGGNAGTTTYTYDGDGNMLTSKDPSGQLISYTYDGLDRKTAEYSGTVATGTALASWSYDQTPLANGTDALGEPTSSTSFDSAGHKYTESITGYDISYNPTGSSLVLPASNPLGICTSASPCTVASTYFARTAQLATASYSADGPLAAEQVSYSYEPSGLLRGFNGASKYLQQTDYNEAGHPESTTFGPTGKQLVQDYTYDPATTRLLQSITNLQPDATGPTDQVSYAYDESGNITATSNVQDTGGTQTQCYTYNDLDQLTTAWTDTGGTTTSLPASPVQGIGGCANGSPAAANIGGSAPYWESYTYDLLGDRTSETTYNTALPPARDTLANATTQEIEYPGGNFTNSPVSNAPSTAQAQPDSAASILTSSPGGTVTSAPNYNADGQLTSEPVSKTTGSSPPSAPPAMSKVTYDPQGQVAAVTTSAGTSSYTYDADGNILLESDPGSTTLFIDSGVEQITQTGQNSQTGERFLAKSSDGTVVVEAASPSASATYYEVANQQGTALEAIDASTLTTKAPSVDASITRRYFDPWGDPVGSAPSSWPDNNAFLGKPSDPVTTLDLLGARQYDPATGAFLTLDPVLETGSPQQMGGYSYAADNPVTHSDPNGACIRTPTGGCVTLPHPGGDGQGGSGAGEGGSGAGEGGSGEGEGYGGSAGGLPPTLTFPGWGNLIRAIPSYTYPLFSKTTEYETSFGTIKVSSYGDVTVRSNAHLEVDLSDMKNPQLDLHTDRGTTVFINSDAFAKAKDASSLLGDSAEENGVPQRYAGSIGQSVMSSNVMGTRYDVTVIARGPQVTIQISATRDFPTVSGHLETDIELTPRTTTPWSPAVTAVRAVAAVAHAPAAIASAAAAAGGAIVRNLQKAGDWFDGQGGGDFGIPVEGPDMPVVPIAP